MAKYLLLTMVLNVFAILITVVVINVFFRGPTTHLMPGWIRTAFLEVLPLLLHMQRPRQPTTKTNLHVGGERAMSMTRYVRRRAPTRAGEGERDDGSAAHAAIVAHRQTSSSAVRRRTR